MSRALAFAVMAAAAIATSHATTPAGSDHPGAAPVLLGLDSVRAELDLNSLQRSVLDSLRQEYRTAARKLTSPMPATPEARAAAERKLVALTESFNARAIEVLNLVQRKRFAEIEAQALGATMLFSPTTQKTLGLSAKQVEKIESLRVKGSAYVGKINRRFCEGKIDWQDRVHLLRQRRLAQGEALLKILTSSQRAAFLALGGKKFTI